MSSTSSLKAVIFDVDGVLINSIPIHVKAFNHALAKYGLKLSDLKDDHRASSVKHIVECIEQEHGIQVNFESFLKELSDYIGEQLQKEQPVVDPVLFALLEELQSSGIKLAIGSSAVRFAVERKLDVLGIKHFFSVIIGAESVQRHKPAPDIYLEALRQLGLQASECVVIEDALAGVQAAQAAGIPVVSFGQYNENPAQTLGADLHVSSWAQLTLSSMRGL